MTKTIRHAYDAWSKTYDEDRNLTRDLDAEVLRKALKGKKLGDVLELGCGTGKNTAFVAKAAKSVLALDFSPAMLARAREKVRAKNVEFRLADLTQAWTVGAGAFDLIVCDLVLEHVADLTPVFAQAARALRPSGRFLICELHPFRQYQGKQAEFSGGKIAAHVHHLTDFTRAAESARLALRSVGEFWHAEDGGKPPRLLTLEFAAGA